MLLIALTMAFFAANSLLARAALRSGHIDANSFTAVRLISGALALAVLTRARGEAPLRHGSWTAAVIMVAYAFTFSWAYLSLTASTGALVMFTAVQITMLGAGILRGQPPRALEWAGLAVAFGGFVYLLLPGLAAPSPAGVVLMTASGIAWGGYSLQARGVASPVEATTGNFLRSVPLTTVAFLALAAATPSTPPHADLTGLVLAATSGAITSGLGYVLWYTALRGLRPSLGAMVQLTVPLLAAVAGVFLLGEPLTSRLALASLLILGGIALALAGRLRRG